MTNSIVLLNLILEHHCWLNVYFAMIGINFYDKTNANLQGLKTAIIEGDVIGGTCVNRGCVPSKALLAVSGRMRELQNEQHLKSFGIQVLFNDFFSYFYI